MPTLRQPPPARDRSRPASRQDFHDDALPHRVPTDVLSDGYDSGGEAGSEQVLALLRSGVSSRQSMDLNNAKSEYKRAASLQNSRARKRKPKKLDIWLWGLAKVYGKERLRAAAKDIQRCYRGFLGREDAAWHRLQKKKKIKEQQALLEAQRQRASAAILQRVFRGHRARLQANWRRRKRAERRVAVVALQANIRRLQAKVQVGQMRYEENERLVKVRTNATLCLQRVVKWALSRKHLTTLVRGNAAKRITAATSRTLAHKIIPGLRLQEQLQEQARRDEEAKLEQQQRELLRRAAASTLISSTWRQRAARVALLRAMAIEHSPDAQTSCRCKMRAAFAEEIEALSSATCPQVDRACLRRWLATRLLLRRRASSAHAVQGAWHAHCARRARAGLLATATRREARRLESCALLIQRWWLACSLKRVLARRRAYSDAAAGDTTALREYGEAGRQAWSRLSAVMRGWRARKEATARSSDRRRREAEGKEQAACVCVQTAWRGHASRRVLARELSRAQESAVLELDAARETVGAAVVVWCERLRAQAQVEERKQELRGKAATRIQAAACGHAARGIARGLKQARERMLAGLRHAAAVRVAIAWRAYKARRERRLRQVREQAVMAVAASQLQSAVRRFWMQWTMRFYATQARRVQCAWRCWDARQRLAELWRRREMEQRAAAEALAAQRAEQLAREREREVLQGTRRMIAAVQARCARAEYIRKRRSAVLLACAWRGNQARDVFMWRCLRRKQEDEMRLARRRAAQRVAASLVSRALLRRHAAALASCVRLQSAWRAAWRCQMHQQERAAACGLQAAVRARRAGRMWGSLREAGHVLALLSCRRLAVLQVQALRRSARALAGMWRGWCARQELSLLRQARQEHEEQQRQAEARKVSAMCLQAAVRRLRLQQDRETVNHLGQAARSMLAVLQRARARRHLASVALAGADLCRFARAAVCLTGMQAATAASRQLSASCKRRTVRSEFVRVAAGLYSASHLVAALARRDYSHTLKACLELCRAAAGCVAGGGHVRHRRVRLATNQIHARLRAEVLRRGFVQAASASVALCAVLRRVPARETFAREAAAASAIKRVWMVREAKAEMLRRRKQRARDALLKPALAPSKQPPLHEIVTYSPCPPRTARRTDSVGPCGFRKRILSSGPVTPVPPPCSVTVADQSGAPLRVCRARSSGVGDGCKEANDDAESMAREEEERERRLLQAQQQRISDEITRAGGSRDPTDEGFFPHEIMQGSSGAALLALRLRKRN